MLCCVTTFWQVKRMKMRETQTIPAVSLAGMVQAILIVLKSCGVIKWRWLTVLSPAILINTFGLTLVLFGILFSRGGGRK